MSRTFVALGFAAALLAGCGNTFGEQALIGSGAGVAGSLLLGGDPILGTALGLGGNLLYCHFNYGACYY